MVNRNQRNQVARTLAAKDMQLKEINKEMQECTFHPIIKSQGKNQSFNSVQLSSRKRSGLKTENRLIKGKLQKELKLELARKISKERELTECSFQPITSQNSNRIVQTNSYSKIISPNLCNLSRDFKISDSNLSLSQLTSDTKNLKNQYDLLFEDSQSRNARKIQIYKNLIDKECSFKPKLVSKSIDIGRISLYDRKDLSAS